MSQSYVSKALRERVAKQAHYRCGYCLTQEENVGTPMEIEHIVPEALGGVTEEDNLWLSCTLCNRYKADRASAPDPITDEIVRLFNPRHQVWDEHFAWTEAGDEIIGKTAIGRATVAALKLNRIELVKSRRKWVAAGWHPPKD